MKFANHIVFGGQGFIGQNLCLRLADLGASSVISIDKNLWNINFSDSLLGRNNFVAMNYDIANHADEIVENLSSLMLSHDTQVWHLAANSDIQLGNNDVNVDLRDTFYSTIGVVDICKRLSFKHLAFASSSAVYGDWGGVHAYSETDPLFPISNYGAMKLASEAYLSSAYKNSLESLNIFRFPNVVGTPATHGVILDLIKKLKIKKTVLNVLGDGTQTKPYLHVSDLISAMLHVVDRQHKSLEVFNIASDTKNVSVAEIAQMVKKAINPKAEIRYGTGRQGWIGDVPEVHFATQKIESLGWKSKLSGTEAVQKTVDDVMRGVFEQ
jgi:UDP-glucose 4-epimerase